MVDGEIASPVLAAAPGRVERVRTSPVGGLCVFLQHDCPSCDETSRYYTGYCHLQSTLVEEGDVVPRGQEIATMGHSGTGAFGTTHLHFMLCTFLCVDGASDGVLAGTRDPMSFDAGCYPLPRDVDGDGHLHLTRPIPCSR